MDPVGQSRPISTSDPGSPPIEFLLRLLDLSKGISTGTALVASFTPAILERALSSEGAGPLRFLPLPSPLSRALVRVLSSPDTTGGISRVQVSVTRHDSSLEWLFSGKDIQARFRSDLLLSRTGGISLRAMEDPSPPFSPAPSGGEEDRPPVAEQWLAGSFAPLPEETSEGDRVSGSGVLRVAAGAGGARGSGPVVAWPAYVPGQTVEFAVRWLSSGEVEKRSGASGQEGGGGILFTLEIPWEDPAAKNDKKSVRLMGRFLTGGTIELSSPSLPDSFRSHLLSRQEILTESLRIFPGVALRLHLSGKSEGGAG